MSDKDFVENVQDAFIVLVEGYSKQEIQEMTVSYLDVLTKRIDEGNGKIIADSLTHYSILCSALGYKKRMEEE